MKRCPECRRDYVDDSLAFCLEDGAALIQGSVPSPDEPATQIISPHVTSEDPTRNFRSSDIPSVSEGQSRSRTKPLLIVSLAAIGILAAGFIGYRYMSSASSGQIQSIAVMPFVNESGNADVEYLSDGMTETLISSLSQIPNLSVKARSTVFYYKSKETTPKAIGQELGVQAVLLGRVAQRGDDVKLSLELVNTQTQDVIWSGQYNRKQADLVSLQNDIARDVLSKLQTRLSGADEQKLAKTYTTNSEAYQLYLKGRFYWNKRTAENLKKAMEQFQMAADIDPNYALAYAGLADCYVVSGDYSGAPNKETLPKARAFAERALQLDGSLVEAQTSLAYSYSLLWQWDRAETEFKRAFELNPNYATAYHWYSLYLVETGRLEEAMREIRRAQELDPLSLIVSYNLALNYVLAGDLNASIAQSKRLIDLDPNFPRAHQSLGYALVKQERFAEAIEEFKKGASLSPNDRQSLRDLGYGFGLAGQHSEAVKVLKDLQTNYEKGEAFAADVAAVYAALGEKDQAFLWLEKDFEKREGRLARIRYHVPYESLRTDPRYTDMLRRMGLKP